MSSVSRVKCILLFKVTVFCAYFCETSRETFKTSSVNEIDQSSADYFCNLNL